jgi:hypothetical protein
MALTTVVVAGGPPPSSGSVQKALVRRVDGVALIVDLWLGEGLGGGGFTGGYI